MTRRVGIQRIAGRNPNRIGYPEKDIRSLGRKYRLRGGKLRAETKSFWPFVFGHHHFNYLKDSCLHPGCNWLPLSSERLSSLE
jgi:hypothetical protein